LLREKFSFLTFAEIGDPSEKTEIIIDNISPPTGDD